MGKEPSYQRYDPSWGAEPIQPTPDESLVEMFQRTVSKFPDKPAAIFLEHVTTYRELDRLSDQLAQALIEMGIKKGDRVATMLPNCTQHIVAFFGILKAGGIVVGFNVMLKGEEAGYILEDSGAKVVIVLDLVYPVVKAEAERLGIGHVVAVHVKDFSESSANIPALFSIEKAVPEETVDFMELIADDTGVPPEVTFQPKEDLAMLVYTSGTTGFPKGAMISHHNIYDAILRHTGMWGLKCEDLFLMVFPQFHIAGYCICLLSAIQLGGTLLPIPIFEPGEALRLCERHKVTFLGLPPTAYIGLLNHPDFSKFDLSSLRITGAGAAPVPPALQAEWQERVGTYLYCGYGATETSGTGPGIFEMKNRNKPSAGTLGSTMCELKIVDQDGTTVPRDTVGELMLRGPGVVRGYWNKPEESRKAFTDDGWWRSGDAGYMDDEGFVFFVERIKDLIVSSAYNIAPVEVENQIFEHPSVQDVAVIGVADEYRGETVKAYIVLKADSVGNVTEEEIIRFCREKMAVYKAPRMVEFVDELPKTQSGKVLRRILREKHAESGKD